jgi:hypothetical protein
MDLDPRSAEPWWYGIMAGQRGVGCVLWQPSRASGLEKRARRENAGCYGQWIDQYFLAKPGVRLVVFVIG